MGLTGNIAKNTALQFGGRVVGTLFGLAALALMTRTLGPDGYGQFTSITGYLQFFGIVVDLGLTLTLVQMVSEPNADESRIVGNIFSLRFITALIFFGISAALVWVLPYPMTVKWGVLAGSIGFIAMTQTQVLVGLFQRHLRMASASIAEVAGRVVLVAGVALMVVYHWGLMGAIAALVAANIVQFFITYGFAQRVSGFGLRFDRAIIRDILRRTWPIGLSIAFNLVYLKGDVVILSLTRAQSEVGLYGAAYKVVDTVTVIPMMFMGLVLPILTEAWSAGNRELFGRRLQKAFEFMTLLALPMVGGAIVLGRNIMQLVAGYNFRSSGALLAILILAAGAVFFSALGGHVIVAIGKQRATMWAYGIDALLSLIGYIVLVPRFGAPAAAWVTVFSEVFIALYVAYVALRHTKFVPQLGRPLKMVLSAALMTLVLFALPHMHVLLAVLIGAAAYLVFLIVLRVVNRDMVRELVSL